MIVCAGLVSAALASCLGPTVGQVNVAALGTPVEKPLALPAGKSLEFAVHADEYDYSGQNNVLIDVTLLRGGAAVATMSCPGFEIEGGAGCGSSATHLNSSCAMKVPAGGSDAIKVLAHLQNVGNKATFKGLAVYIRD